MAERLAADDLVASLLLVHGLHPHDVHRRVSDALDRVRPYLGSHGGDVDLLEVTGDRAARVRRSCKSCPSSAVTLELAVEDAVRAAAPEISSIEVVRPNPRGTGVIPAESLLAHVHSNGPPTAATWHPVPELAELQPGEVAGFLVPGPPAGMPGRRPDVRLSGPLPGLRRLAGRRATAMGARAGLPALRRAFRRRARGRRPESERGSPRPLPLLSRDGVLSVALREPMGAPA